MTVEIPLLSWKDYELVDSGNYEKLERFGQFYIIRPEPKALWNPSLSQDNWNKLCHTKFIAGAGFSKSGKEESGNWVSLKKMPEQWDIKYEGDFANFTLRLGLTAFKHVGVFPEQAPNWDYIYQNTKELINKKGREIKVLNLFAYTGAASLAAKMAGAEVTHLDSVKQVINWANENMVKSKLDNIHWVLEDALKFAYREAKRGNKYDAIILDPPAYGHGPKGEKWKLDENLYKIMLCVSRILEDKDSFMVLNLYSNGFSATLGETLVKSALNLKNPDTFKLESGELGLEDRYKKILPLSIYVRLRR